MTATDQHAMLQELRRPFTSAAVRFKPQTWNAEKGKGIAICYIDARLVVERLNRVAGFDWNDDYEQLDRTTMLCRLTVCGTTRQDVGVAESSAAGGLKALYSDALKRAAVRFGVGVSLYAVPQLRIDTADVWIKQKDGKPGGLTDSGLVKLRRLYEQWLSRQGAAFGDALDHGDEPDSVGEIVDAPAEAPPAAEASDPTPDLIVAEQLARLGVDGRRALKAHFKRLGIKPSENTHAAWVDAILTHFGGIDDETGEPHYADLVRLVAKLDEQAKWDAEHANTPGAVDPTPLQRKEASERLYDDEAEGLAAASGVPMYGEGSPS